MKRGESTQQHSQALLIIDVINDFDFPEGDKLLELALPMAHKIHKLKERARSSSVPVIYINDNFGRWQSDFKKQIAYCERPESKGREITQLLRPGEEDYFVLKPKHSGFYSTTLDVLLKHLGCKTVVLCGIATNICVLFTANDAYMRNYNVVVPPDCSAANTREDHESAIQQMAKVLKAGTTLSKEFEWSSDTDAEKTD